MLAQNAVESPRAAQTRKQASMGLSAVTPQVAHFTAEIPQVLRQKALLSLLLRHRS